MEPALRRCAFVAAFTAIMITAASWKCAQAYVANDVYIGEFTSPYGPVKIYNDANQPRDKIEGGGFLIRISGTVPNQTFFDRFVKATDLVHSANPSAHHFSWSLSVNCAERALRSWHFFWYNSQNDIIAIQHFNGALTAASTAAYDAKSLNAVIIRKFCS